MEEVMEDALGLQDIDPELESSGKSCSLDHGGRGHHEYIQGSSGISWIGTCVAPTWYFADVERLFVSCRSWSQVDSYQLGGIAFRRKFLHNWTYNDGERSPKIPVIYHQSQNR